MSKLKPIHYFVIFLVLMALLVVTAGAARFDFGPGNTIIAIGVAIAKASLILVFFMDLRYSRGATRLAALGALFWLGLLFVLCMNDYNTRGALGIAGK